MANNSLLESTPAPKYVGIQFQVFGSVQEDGDDITTKPSFWSLLAPTVPAEEAAEGASAEIFFAASIATKHALILTAVVIEKNVYIRKAHNSIMRCLCPISSLYLHGRTRVASNGGRELNRTSDLPGGGVYPP
jgi:hypothetical protein